MTGLFVSPHSLDYAVGEVAFVGASGFSAGLAFELLAGEVILGCFVVVFLDGGGYVDYGVDATVASVVEAAGSPLGVHFLSENLLGVEPGGCQGYRHVPTQSALSGWFQAGPIDNRVGARIVRMTRVMETV